MPTLTSGNATIVAGTTPNLTADLYDTDGTALLAASITSLTFTIKDSDGNVINERDETDINDTGIGSLEDVEVDGVTVVRLTIKPTVDDTAYQSTTGVLETHYWRIDWGWNDSDAVARTGGDIYSIKVERMPA